MALEWNYAPYKMLFPDLKASPQNPSKTADLNRYARVLSQTWGSAVFVIPMTTVVF